MYMFCTDGMRKHEKAAHQFRIAMRELCCF